MLELEIHSTYTTKIDGHQIKITQNVLTTIISFYLPSNPDTPYPDSEEKFACTLRKKGFKTWTVTSAPFKECPITTPAWSWHCTWTLSWPPEGIPDFDPCLIQTTLVMLSLGLHSFWPDPCLTLTNDDEPPTYELATCIFLIWLFQFDLLIYICFCILT